MATLNKLSLSLSCDLVYRSQLEPSPFEPPMLLILRRTTKQCSVRDRQSSDVKQSTTSLLTYESKVRSDIQWELSTPCCAAQVCCRIGKVTWQVEAFRSWYPGPENMALTLIWDIQTEDSKCGDVLRKYHHTMRVWLSDSRNSGGLFRYEKAEKDAYDRVNISRCLSSIIEGRPRRMKRFLWLEILGLNSPSRRPSPSNWSHTTCKSWFRTW